MRIACSLSFVMRCTYILFGSLMMNAFYVAQPKANTHLYFELCERAMRWVLIFFRWFFYATQRLFVYIRFCLWIDFPFAKPVWGGKKKCKQFFFATLSKFSAIKMVLTHSFRKKNTRSFYGMYIQPQTIKFVILICILILLGACSV